jgi:hypothetical protein
MPDRDGSLALRGEVGVLREEREDRVGGGEQSPIHRDPDQGVGHALGDRSEIVECRVVELRRAQRPAAPLVGALEILLEGELPVTDDRHGIEVGEPSVADRG